MGTFKNSSIVLLKNFNNYYNRIVKKYNTVEDYVDSLPDMQGYKILANINFNPNDGITTELIINWMSSYGETYGDEEFNPDYLLMVDGPIVSEQSPTETVAQRWFIIEMERTRAGQYKLTLRRDLMADFYNDIINSKAFIQKGIINNNDNNLLFNSENYGCNQIKTKEMLLPDNTMCPWLLIYLKKDTLGQSNVINVNVDNENEVYETLLTSIDNWELYGYQDSPLKVSDTLEVKWVCTCGNDPVELYFNLGEETYHRNLKYGPEFWNLITDRLSMHVGPRLVTNTNSSQYETAIRLEYPIKKTSEIERINKYNGKIVKDSNGKYFKVIVSTSSTSDEESAVSSGSLFTLMRDTWNASSGNNPINPNNQSMWIKFKNMQTISVVLLPLPEMTCSGNLNQITTVSNNPLYDVICCPYPVYERTGQTIDDRFYYFHEGGEDDVEAYKEVSKKTMDAIVKVLGATEGNIIDYQIIPYCPIPQWVRVLSNGAGRNDRYIDEIAGTYIDFKYTEDGEEKIFSRCWIVPETNVDFNLSLSQDQLNELKVWDGTTTTSRIKLYNECRFVRLCSPNYCGSYEMNIAKNGGNINTFFVSMTLKPMIPFIYITPDLKGLYGNNFNDNRGLILSGDFSLGMVRDAWNQYLIQNKNYQAIFDREIQSIDFNNNIARQEAILGLTGGAIGGTVAGAAAGAKLGGGYGAIAGAAIGLTAGTVGGVLDYNNLNARMAEARDFKIDMFNMQLGNIKALPKNITKSDPINANNKYFPFIEFYQATSEEEAAFENKIKYDGMTIGIIDDIKNWVGGDGNQQYVKAELIRCETISDDYHILNEIGVELNKGVYM